MKVGGVSDSLGTALSLLLSWSWELIPMEILSMGEVRRASGRQQEHAIWGVLFRGRVLGQDFNLPQS